MEEVKQDEKGEKEDDKGEREEGQQRRKGRRTTKEEGKQEKTTWLHDDVSK